MKYDFDKIVDRSENRSAKHDERLKKFGRADVLPLWVADMDFKTAQPIIDALTARAEQGMWGYTTRPESYFDAVLGWQEKRHDWKIDRSLVSWSLGVVPSLSAMVKLYTKKGDKVLIQTPVYSEFYDVAEAWDRIPLENKLIEKDGQWSIDFDDFEKKLDESKLFILCSPHNPLGIVWSRDDLTRMAQTCVDKGVLMISDEIHSDLVFWGKKHIPTAILSPAIAKNTISCISGTKTFNLAGLQASTNVFPNAELKKTFDKFWMNMDIHRNNAFSLTAMEAAFLHGEEWLTQLLTYLENNFTFINEYCKANIPSIKPTLPDATYLVWLDCRELEMSNENLRDFMINKARLGLNEGYTFGRSLTGYMRLNAACPRSVIEKALGQLEEAVNAL